MLLNHFTFSNWTVPSCKTRNNLFAKDGLATRKIAFDSVIQKDLYAQDIFGNKNRSLVKLEPAAITKTYSSH